MGAPYRFLNEYKKSNDYYTKSLDVLNRKSSNLNEKTISTCLSKMSLNYQRLAEYQKSNECINKALKLNQINTI